MVRKERKEFKKVPKKPSNLSVRGGKKKGERYRARGIRGVGALEAVNGLVTKPCIRGRFA